MVSTHTPLAKVSYMAKEIEKYIPLSQDTLQGTYIPT